MSYQYLTIERNGPVERVMLNRPDVRNAFNEHVIAELTKSFAFLKSSLTGTPDAKMDAQVDMFGQKASTRRVWVMTTTHLHEHLGQLIAYARSNKVVPPWSK